MPGRLIANHENTHRQVGSNDSTLSRPGAANSKMTSSPAAQNRVEDKSISAPVTAATAVVALAPNGSNAPAPPTSAQRPVPEGQQLSNGTLHPTKEPSVISHDLEKGLDRLPPEIAHITFNYQPFSKLIDRVAQECFNSLNETVNELASLPEIPQMNGNTAVNTFASALASQKRLKWLDFASTNRERFVKLLVLLQWSRRVEDVGRIIDIVAWLNSQMEAYGHVEESLGLLKRDFHAAKLPNPDFKTAVEVLATGRSARMPDLNYIPPPQLTPKKLLKNLKTINVQLHIRLNLHENLPKPLQNFSISSGRVTFKVSTEFEVDLSVAHDDPSSQFYFIDFRFLCFQHSEIPTDHLRSQFEGKINNILASEGLTGCYNFLHNFVLTHKVNTLRRQALDLAQTFWAGSLYIQYLHRTLVIQYWTGCPGKKSWIEIGVSSGRREHGYTAESYTHLHLKWMQSGKEVTTANLISLDTDDLKMEDILRSIIALHTSTILSSIHQGLIQMFPSHTKRLRALKCTRSDSDPSGCILQFPFGPDDVATLQIEPVSGKFALSPPTLLSRRCVAALNRMKDPSNEAFGRLKWWLTSEMHAKIEARARQDGWLPVNVHSVSRALLHEICQNDDEPAVFVPWPSIDQWKIIVTVHPSGVVRWWVHQADRQSYHMVYPPEEAINSREAFALPHEGFCKQLQGLVASELCSRAISLCLFRCGFPSVQTHNLQVDQGTTMMRNKVPNSPMVWTKRSNFTKQLAAKYSKDVVGIQFLKLEPVSPTRQPKYGAMAIYLVKGFMRNATALFAILAKSKIGDCSFVEDGRFAFRIRARVESDDLISQIQERLAGFERLRQWSAILAEKNMPMRSVTLSSIEFTYAQDVATISGSNEKAGVPQITAESKHDLSVSIQLGDGSQLSHIDAEFFPRLLNPHQRVQNHFANYLKDIWQSEKASSAGRGFQSHRDTSRRSPLSEFLLVLDSTFGIMLAFDFLEIRNKDGPTSAVAHTHTLSSYKVSYRFPDTHFSITGRRNRKGFFWIVSSSALRQLMAMSGESGPDTSSLKTKLHKALKAFFKEWGSKDDNILLPTGVAVDSKNIKDILLELDTLVRANAPSMDEIAAAQTFAAAATAAAAAVAAAAVASSSSNKTQSAQSQREATSSTTAETVADTTTTGTITAAASKAATKSNVATSNGISGTAGRSSTSTNTGNGKVNGIGIGSTNVNKSGNASTSASAGPGTDKKGNAGKASQQHQQSVKKKVDPPDVIQLDD